MMNCELTAALETIQPELLAMTRLFGLPDADWDPPARYELRAEELPGVYRISFTSGDLSAAREVRIPSETDPRMQRLHRRRAARRLCKQTLYDLLRKMTGASAGERPLTRAAVLMLPSRFT